MNQKASVRAALAGLFVITLAASSGCGPRRVLGPGQGNLHVDAASDLDARAEYVKRDPVRYLRDVEKRTEQLQQYTLTLTRQERRGLFPTLRDPERIMAWYRREPFSIRFKWIDPGVKYGESTYVSGLNGNKVRFVPRHGLFGLPPGITSVELQTPVTWGEARYPVTDFGLERMLERTLDSIRESRGDYIIEYRGLRTLDNGAVTHHLWMKFPPSKHVAPVQELFVDARTDLPVLTLIKRESGDLEAAYLYEDVNTGVRLTDDDFLLEIERRAGSTAAEAPAGDAPSPRTGARTG
jgi:hypothetical protein